MSSSARLSTPAPDPEARPRNRRLGTATKVDDVGVSSSRASSLLRTASHSPAGNASPIPATRIGPPSRSSSTAASARPFDRESSSNNNNGKAWFDSSWSTGWASVQDLATSFLSGEPHRGDSPRRPGLKTAHSTQPGVWGPKPPDSSRSGIHDVAAGTLAEREMAYKARKTASVLESYEGVNGGLDVAGKFKRRNSDEEPRSVATGPVLEDQLVYIHHIKPEDTYAGIILKYRCKEDALRKANGLWSRDNIQIRSWLAVPVDACEVKGRPCDGPSYYSKEVDLLATTPGVMTPGPSPLRNSTQTSYNDFFAAAQNGKSHQEQESAAEEKPWTHVRWAKLDHCAEPVEIARVSRKAMGYFPPRRKKSIRTMSSLSTPRVSLDVPSVSLGSDVPDSPVAFSDRRQSMRANRPTITSAYASSAPTPSRSRVGSGNDDLRPAWMKRPGGVGTLGRNVRAPGPERDYFNTWTKKHIPGLNIDSLPSMAIMGSESARFGITTDENAAIVESPFEDGRDLSSQSKQGSGLDKAAAAIETWLRGAWAKRPNTPILGPSRPRGRDGDLIELEDTNSDDGRLGGMLDGEDSDLLTSNYGAGGAATTTTTITTSTTTTTMPICIECRHPVKTLWTQYSGAGDKSSGHNIRLTVCKKCGRFCDKYVEHDYIVLFIDLVLIKPQVYRHLLHNTLMRDRDQFDPSIIRLGVLLLLFDVYLTWARIEKQSVPENSALQSDTNFGRLAQQPIVFQYMFFLILCTASTLAFHMSIRFLTSSVYSPLAFFKVLPLNPRPNSVSTALLVSSSTKLFPILMVIWEYDVPAAARSLGWAVVANNVEALKILLDCGYGVAALLATAGALSRWLVGRAVLWVAGLDGVDSQGEGSVAEEGKALWALIVYVRDWVGQLAM
ncbi:Arv1-like family-domain-containing protein [Coniella lustricola]|uniref:Protein ARV n=1 Tax=Coniella lustricola TaxID=2025994 RepID=A0A2T3ANQ8_9PEZI|nr:Arv1-like family-domain-containing protein [Coniella lustricola]